MKLERLDDQDANSALWKKLKAHLETDLNNLRRKNDGIDNDAIQTAFIRGQIAKVKALLALERGPAQVADDGK